MNRQRTRVAAYALLVQNRALLLCRIAEPGTRWHGYWTLPGGGLEFGESPEEAMVREVGEETGLMVRPLRLAHVDSTLGEYAGEKLQSIRIIYHAEIVGGELRHEVGGTTDLCQWFSREELPSLGDLAEVGRRLI